MADTIRNVIQEELEKNQSDYLGFSLTRENSEIRGIYGNDRTYLLPMTYDGVRVYYVPKSYVEKGHYSPEQKAWFGSPIFLNEKVQQYLKPARLNEDAAEFLKWNVRGIQYTYPDGYEGVDSNGNKISYPKGHTIVFKSDVINVPNFEDGYIIEKENFDALKNQIEYVNPGAYPEVLRWDNPYRIPTGITRKDGQLVYAGYTQGKRDWQIFWVNPNGQAWTQWYEAGRSLFGSFFDSIGLSDVGDFVEGPIFSTLLMLSGNPTAVAAGMGLAAGNAIRNENWGQLALLLISANMPGPDGSTMAGGTIFEIPAIANATQTISTTLGVSAQTAGLIMQGTIEFIANGFDLEAALKATAAHYVGAQVGGKVGDLLRSDGFKNLATLTQNVATASTKALLLNKPVDEAARTAFVQTAVPMTLKSAPGADKLTTGQYKALENALIAKGLNPNVELSTLLKGAVSDVLTYDIINKSEQFKDMPENVKKIAFDSMRDVIYGKDIDQVFANALTKTTYAMLENQIKDAQAQNEGWANHQQKIVAQKTFGPQYGTEITPDMYHTIKRDLQTTTFNADSDDKIATVNEARDAAMLGGFNTFVFDNKLYTIGGFSLDAADALYKKQGEEFIFPQDVGLSEEGKKLAAYKAGFNTVDLGKKLLYDERRNQWYFTDNIIHTITPEEQRKFQQQIDFPGVFDGSKYKDVNEAAKAAAAVDQDKFRFGDAIYVVKAPESVTNQIKNAGTFNEAFALAQEKLGEGNVFEWNGKLYVNKTKEQAATDPFNGNKYEDRGAAAYAAHMAGKTTFTWGGNVWELPKDYASQISKALGDNPYQSTAETKRLLDASIKAASSNVVPAEKFRLDQTGIPAVDKIIGAIAYSQGLAVVGTGNILESLSETQALATGGSFQNTLKNVGNVLQTFGERMKPEEFATMAKPQVKNIYDDLARAEKTENIFERGAIVAKSLLTNPIGTWTIAGTEMGEEAPGLLLGGLAIVFSPLTVGVGSGAGLLAAISATLNGAEVFGSSGAERYRELIAQGKTEEEARVGGIVMGAVQAPITIITEFAGDKATALAYLTGIKSGMQGAVQTIVNPITVNALTELVEEYVQGVSARIVKGEPQNFAEDSARAIFAAAIGASASAGFVAPGAINSAAQIGLDRYGQSVTFQEYINNTKSVDPSTLNMNAKVAKLSDGSDLTLAGLQLMLPATGISRSFIYDIAPDITVSRNDIVAYSSNNEPIQFRYSQPFFQKHLIQVGPIPNISDADARRLLQTQGRSNPTQAEIDQVVDKAKDEQDTDIAKQVSDPFTVSLEEVKEAARAAGYAISDEEAKKYVGERLESEAIPLLQQQFDPLGTTEEEVRQIFAERGYNPTQEEIERFVGSTPEAQIQSQIKTYVDPRMLYPEDIKNLAAQEGYEISDARARELSGQKDKYASLDALRAEFDAGAVTLDEARAMFAQTPYKPTDAEIQQFIGSKSESQIQQDIANYVDPRYVTAQEIKDAAAQEGYQITDEQALALAGQKSQQEALAQFRAEIDPQAVNEAEVRAFFREQGYQPTNEELQQFIVSRSEDQVMADIAAYVDPRYITLAEVKQVANEEGYAITDDEAFALTGQKSQKEVLDQLRAKADASAVLQSEAQEFFQQYGYTPTAEELEQFTGSRAEDLVRSEIESYVDPRYVTLEEVKEAARAEGYDITDEEAAALVGQKSQEEAISQFREQIDPKAVIDAEAQAFFAEFGYVPNNDELSLFIQSRSEDEVRADIQTYIDPRQVTREEAEAKFRELQSEYEFTPEEIEQFIKFGPDVVQEDVLGGIGAYIDPRYVTPEEVKAGYAELGLTAPIEEDISKFTGQTAQEGLQERLQEYLPTAQFNYTAKQLADLQAQNERNQRIQEMNDQFVRDITALIDQDIDINTAIEQTLGKIDDPTQRQLIDVGSPTVQMLAQQQATKKAAQQQQKQQLVQQGMELIGGQTPADTQVMSEPFKPDVQSLYSGDPGDKFISPLAPFLEKVEEGSYTGEQPPPTTAEQPLAEPKDLTDMKRREQGYFTYGQPSEIEQNIAAASDPFGYYSAMAMSGGMKEGGMVVPLMAEGGGTRYGRYAGGGLNLVPHTGKMRVDFREGDAVTGPGDGQSDDIPAMLADGEFVIPADVVAALGNGSTKAGSDKLYDMMHSIRSHVRSADPKKLPPPVKSPLDYISKRPKAKRR